MNITVERRTKAYLDFVQGLKGHAQRETIPALGQVFAKKEQVYAGETGRRPESWKDVAPLMQDELLWKFYEHITHHSQHMMWDGVLHIVDQNRDTIEQELAAGVPNPKGSLRLNPDIELPRYYKEVEFHLRPGGMWNGTAQGFYTDIANWVYFAGNNDNREAQRQAVVTLPDRPYKRILDLACGIGQSTWPLAERFPGAEIHGTDLSAPLLVYAHKVAEEQGLAIHYAQNNAEHTDYPDAHFDLVFAYILFHEIPDKAAVNVIREAYRLLEPGGVFAIADIRPYAEMQPLRAFISDFQTYGNGEAYWRSHCSRDFFKLLGEAGFENVRNPEGMDRNRPQTVYIAEKPSK